jgi:hypothetical protein
LMSTAASTSADATVTMNMRKTGLDGEGRSR